MSAYDDDDWVPYDEEIEALLRPLYAYFRLDPEAAESRIKLHRRLTYYLGLQVKKRRRGKPAKWLGAQGDKRIDEVDAVRRTRRVGVAKAIEFLKSQNPQRWAGYSERRYHEACARREKLREQLLEPPNPDL